MRYVDGFVLPAPKKNLQAYRHIAQKAGKLWREHGALATISIRRWGFPSQKAPRPKPARR
jgi:uncharacterized protein YbaA (DUF1428 family)